MACSSHAFFFGIRPIAEVSDSLSIIAWVTTGVGILTFALGGGARSRRIAGVFLEAGRHLGGDEQLARVLVPGGGRADLLGSSCGSHRGDVAVADGSHEALHRGVGPHLAAPPRSGAPPVSAVVVRRGSVEARPSFVRRTRGQSWWMSIGEERVWPGGGCQEASWPPFASPSRVSPIRRAFEPLT